MNVRIPLFTSPMMFLILFVGCGSAEKPVAQGTVPFSGTVKLDGKALGGASIIFIPTGGEAIDAGAMTDDSGKYELKADAGRASGAKPGEYKVVISRLLKPDGSVALPSAEKSPMQVMLEEKAKESIPKKYSDLLTPTLTATVPASGGTKDFELTSR